MTPLGQKGALDLWSDDRSSKLRLFNFVYPPFGKSLKGNKYGIQSTTERKSTQRTNQQHMTSFNEPLKWLLLTTSSIVTLSINCELQYTFKGSYPVEFIHNLCVWAQAPPRLCVCVCVCVLLCMLPSLAYVCFSLSFCFFIIYKKFSVIYICTIYGWIKERFLHGQQLISMSLVSTP